MVKKKALKGLLMSSIIVVPAIALTSCASVTTSLYFAELVVSDNTSVLKDKSFSETTYKGWREFMSGDIVDPVKGHVSKTNDSRKNDTNQNQTYKKESIEMPDVNSTNKLLSQGRGVWRRPGKSRDLTFRQIFSGGSNIIVAPGFNHQQAIETVATQEKDKGFVFLDGAPDTSTGREYPNVSSFFFRAEQSGFLTGVAAAEFLNINKDVFAPGLNSSSGDKELKVGGFVGLPLGSTVDFLAGFQHGVIAYNKMIKTTNSGKNSSEKKLPVGWVNLGDEIGSYSVGSFSPGQGTLMSRRLIEKGADMIIPIAGPQTSDLVDAINSQAQNARPVAIVGVDSAQETSSVQKPFNENILDGKTKWLKDANGNKFKTQNIIQFSAIKKLDQATIKVLAAILNKSDPNNENNNNASVVKGFGYLNYGSLGNEAAGISDAGLPYVLKAFPDWAKKSSQKDDTKKQELDPSQVYKNQEFKSLEAKGRLYKTDITKIDKDTKLEDLSDDLAVVSSVVSGQGYSLVSKMDPTEDGSYSSAPTPLFKNEKPLNGSNWGQWKGQIITDKSNKHIITNREED